MSPAHEQQSPVLFRGELGRLIGRLQSKAEKRGGFAVGIRELVSPVVWRAFLGFW